MSEYIHAALLLHSAKQEITEDRIKAVMRAAGIEPDEARIKVLVSSLSKVNIDEVLSAPLAIGPVVPVAPAAQQAPAEKKEEKKEEKPAEEMAGLGALFE